MSRRAVVLILAAVIVAAVAIPALADSGPTAKSASVKGLSKRALAKAKDSLRLARSAKRAARRAQNAANGVAATASAAQGSASAAQSASTAAQDSAANALKAATSANERAGGAELSAREAKAEVASTRPQIGLAEGPVSTESDSFVKLSGGPAVTLTVPPTGLVQVWGQALVESAAGGGDAAVSLYEDGQQVEGQATCGETKGVLFAGAAIPGEPELVATPAVPNLAGTCGSLGAPAPVLFRSTSGEHSFELRYASCACTGGAEKVTFSERRLYVQALP
ncbi:MAG: hypothetical protein AB7V58_13070 [Solirubrobacterales bacterium]